MIIIGNYCERIFLNANLTVVIEAEYQIVILLFRS